MGLFSLGSECRGRGGGGCCVVVMVAEMRERIEARLGISGGGFRWQR